MVGASRANIRFGKDSAGEIDIMTKPNGFPQEFVSDVSELILTGNRATGAVSLRNMTGESVLFDMAGQDDAHAGNVHDRLGADCDGGDFLVWQQQLGMTIAGASGHAAAVPEPAAASLLVAELTVAAAHCRLPRRR